MTKEKAKEPQIRFKGFTNAWEQRKLREVLLLSKEKNDGTYTKDDILAASLGTELKKKHIYFGLRATDESTQKYKVVKKGDIIYTKSPIKGFPNGIIRSNRGESGIVPTLYCVYHCIDNINPSIIQAYFEDKGRLDNYLNPLVNVGARNNVNITDKEFLEGVIYIPAQIEEQSKIVSLLDKLTNLITLHQRKCDLLSKAKKTLLQKMFPKNGETAPEIRFKGFTGAWEQRKLGEIADIVGGGTPSTSNSDYWDGEIDWYAPAEIVDQIFVNSSARKITNQGFSNSSAKMLPVGTVLFTSRAGIGKTAILSKEGCTNQGFQSIIPHENELDSYFIFSRTEELKRYGETTGAGSTFVEVSGKQMANMKLMMPKTMKEQIQIGSYFQNLDNLITLHQHELEKLQNIKKSCLKMMFV